MNKTLRIGFMVASGIAGGCSAPGEAPVPARRPPIVARAAFYTQPFVQPEPGPELTPPRFCHVSVDCMELDSRPFAPCYASGEPCSGEGGFMLVTPRDTQRIETIDRFPEDAKK